MGCSGVSRISFWGGGQNFPGNVGVFAWRFATRLLGGSGASSGFGRGGPIMIFFRFGNLHVAKRHAAHGEAMRIARGVRGHAPPRKFLKRCNLVHFRVYFDQILSLFFSKNYHFLYKKNKYFRYTLAMRYFSRRNV